MLFKKSKDKEQKQQPHGVPMQINLVDVVKQASVQIKYEEIGSWLVMHKTPLFWCHDKGLSIVDAQFIDERLWLKKALGRMVKEIEEQRTQKVQQAKEAHQQQHSQIVEKENKSETGYIG
ncbi:MAG TPA: hypothetical protein VJ110_02340 [Candidatus Nanoarchaeia archaeon]|nr:hypothetical protein [Candidatus Nanoarchaeia archaeon]